MHHRRLARNHRGIIVTTANLTALSKGIRFRQLFGIGFGTMIGVGWMIVAGSWILTAGPGGAIVAFAVGALGVMVVGFAYAEMGSTLPFSGGEIVYVYEGLGTGPAFFIGWLLTFTYVAVCAFEVVASAWIVAVLAPITSGPVLYRILGSDVTLGALVIGYGGLSILTWVNFRGGFASARLQNVATALKLIATVTFVIAALLHGSEANRTPWFQRGIGNDLVTPILAVLATVPVWYGGFNTLPQALGEVADLRSIRNLAVIMTMTILAGFTFFSLVILATASAIPRVALASAEFPVADALFAAFANPWPGRIVLIAGLLGITTSWNASIFCGARVLFSMSRAHIIPAVFARVHPRFGSPAFAALFIGGMSAPIALLGRNSLLSILNLVGLSYATGYLLVALSLLRLRRTAPGLDRPYIMPGHPYWTGLAAALAATFVIVASYNIWRGRHGAVPTEFLALSAWLALGWCVWRAARRVRSSISADERSKLIRER